MRRPTIAALATGFVLAIANFLPSAARAQIDSAKPAVATPASKPIGKVVAATGSVTIEHAGAVVVQANVSSEPARTKTGDSVYLGDVVLTGADGKVGINFTDGSSFNLSSNARMVLDHYVYEPDGKSNATLFNLAKGTFTFVAGSVARTGDMKVDTPVATLGIRGTTPHIEISDDGSARFSTLIEEGNSKLLKKPPAVAAPKPDRSANRRLNICRGC
ncbi:FecR domain-containing protein [Bradyrhizobium sp. SHOUNA76]|nr:FecR domain-containing protein [Bradyrhizobium sp. SHOUNA76]MCJ9730698.1 FecR domain-containing protein [Bradyrhizobium sp. PRIMUS42]